MSETRLKVIEERIGNIRENQAAVRESLSTMEKTLGTLADVRSETLHIIKQQEHDKEDRDEIFTRLRSVEDGKVKCNTSCTVIKTRVDKLETNQRWGIIAILAGIISIIFKKVFV